MSNQAGAEPPQSFRLFIAITVPDEVKDEIERARDALRRAAPEGRVRWATRPQFHLTLKFLGNVEAAQVGPLADAVRTAAGRFAPMQLRAAGVGFFPDSRFPRVVWVGVLDSQAELPRLQSALEEAVRSFTSQEPEGRFAGHVTLGRLKGIRRPEADKLAGVAAGMAEKVFGEWLARDIEIVRSELSPTGARYTSLVRAPLAADIP